VHLVGFYYKNICNYFLTFRILFLSLEIGQIGCPETSIRNCYYSLRNNPEERDSHLLHGGSLKSRIVSFCLKSTWLKRDLYTCMPSVTATKLTLLGLLERANRGKPIVSL
jgi:hypothetical protein